MKVVRVLARCSSIARLTRLRGLNIVLWRTCPFHKKDLLLIHTPILAGRSRRCRYACRCGPIRVKRVLIVMFLTARLLSLDSISLHKAPVGSMLAPSMLMARALEVFVHRGLAETTINDVDVAGMALVAWARLCD